MKIACLIGNPPILSYFLSTLSREHDISLVIREEPPISLGKRIAQRGWKETVNAAIRKLSSRQAYAADAEKVFGFGWHSLPGNVELVTTPEINSDTVRRKLEDLKPDLVLVNGTTIVRPATLGNTPLVLNIHAGLSPYYRGSFCTEWALLNHDPLNIGYTIHRVSGRIDGGDILTQGRVAIEPGDTARSIHMKLIRESAHDALRIIGHLRTGSTPTFYEQLAGEGFLYLARHWTSAHHIALGSMLRRGGMKSMLDKPARKALPIIQL